jgi:transposase
MTLPAADDGARRRSAGRGDFQGDRDDPARFTSSKAVGAHFGLTPKKYQPGETDVTGRVSKVGDAMVRTVLYEAANVLLSRTTRF